MTTPIENEIKLLKNILNNKRLIRLVKSALTGIISKMTDELKFDHLSFFSDNKYKFGNIGVMTDKESITKRLEYLKSTDSTIREKVTAISNSIIDGSDENIYKKYNAKFLCEYIIKSKESKNHDPNSWVVMRANQIEQVVEAKLLPSTDTTHLWAPIYLFYPMYKTKYNNTKKILNTFDNFDPLLYGIKSDALNEPLSDYELEFMSNNNIDSKQNLFWVPGKYIYKDAVKLFPEFENRDKSIIVGGVSGHTILMLELALLLDINWVPILFACIIIQVPHHHSITEIVDALIDMKLLKNPKTTQDAICHLASTMDINLIIAS